MRWHLLCTADSHRCRLSQPLSVMGFTPPFLPPLPSGADYTAGLAQQANDSATEGTWLVPSNAALQARIALGGWVRGCVLGGRKVEW